MTDLRGKRALITGASAGIGAVIAERLGSEGLDLTLTGRRQDRLDEVASRSGAAATLAADLATAAGRAVVAEKAFAADILIHSAGLAQHAPFIQADLDFAEQVVAVNVTGTLHVLKAAAQGMLQRGHGDIIVITSSLAHATTMGTLVYAATKHAQRAMLQALRQELHQAGIRVVEISPGAVADTDFMRSMDHPLVLEHYRARPFRGISPEHVADAVLYALKLAPASIVEVLRVKPTGQDL